MFSRSRSKWFVLVGLMVAIAHHREASACKDGPAAGEQDIWDDHGCWRKFYLWQYREYQMLEDHWGAIGFHDACNNRLPYAKAWNSSYLIAYGLVDNQNKSQWHSTKDYTQLA